MVYGRRSPAPEGDHHPTIPIYVPFIDRLLFTPPLYYKRANNHPDAPFLPNLPHAGPAATLLVVLTVAARGRRRVKGCFRSRQRCQEQHRVHPEGASVI